MVFSFLNRIILFLSLLAGVHNIYAQRVQVSLKPDSTQFRVGSPVKLTLSVKAPEGTKVNFPEINTDPETKIWEILRKDSIRQSKSGGDILMYQDITLATWDTGRIKIGSIPVMYSTNGSQESQTVFTEPLELKVDFVKVDTTQAFKPIVGPLSTEVMWQEFWWLILGALVVFLLIMGYLIYRYIKKRTASSILPQSNPPKPVHERAFFRLKELEESGKLERKEYKAYYGRLTDIVRAYIELTSGVKATDLTTEEILMSYKPVTPSQTEKLRAMLELADKVKFAKYEPDSGEGLQLMNSAKNWIGFEAGV